MMWMRNSVLAPPIINASLRASSDYSSDLEEIKINKEDDVWLIYHSGTFHFGAVTGQNQASEAGDLGILISPR